MKTKTFKRVKQTASALLTALLICSTFSLFVVYYLSLIEQQSLLSNRSQIWNMAIAITEAGVEEGMEQLNDNYSNLGAAPWSSLSGNVYYRSNTLPDGSSYTVYITNNATPVVVARAYVQVGSFLSAQNGSPGFSPGFFAAAGVSTAPTTVTRAVMVTCLKPNNFTAAVAVKTDIDLKGNGVYTDSFDSTNPAKSTNGQYDSSKYTGDKGDIASNGGVTDSVSIQNGNIYGKVHTGVGCPVTVGPNGGVGTHAWQSSNTGFEPGYVIPDANFTFPDTTFPNTSSFQPPMAGNVLVGGTMKHYDNILWGGNKYVSSALTGSTIVLASGLLTNVILAMPNGMTGSENFTVNTGANILIYSGGTSFSAAGNQIINSNGFAGSFIVFCAPTVTTFSLAGNGQFTGVLVAPNADVALKGGGNNNEDFSGMLMANSLVLNGHFRFHYDEALLAAAPNGRFLITSWNEIP
jgi:hypothetical protein